MTYYMHIAEIHVPAVRHSEENLRLQYFKECARAPNVAWSGNSI